MVLKLTLFFVLFVASFKNVEPMSTNMITKNDLKCWTNSDCPPGCSCIWFGYGSRCECHKDVQLESKNMKNECVPCGLLRPDCDCCSCLLCPCCTCPNKK